MTLSSQWAKTSTFLNRLAANAWFAYLTILLLQFKAVNGILLYRDMSVGDTGSYYMNANEWFTIFKGHIAWSPLYTLYFGFLRNFSDDAYLINIAHRLILVFVLTLLVLLVLRRLLPANIAWLMAAWWAVNPAVFDSMYEVHLFATLPTLLLLWLATLKPSPWMRGAVLAGLLLSTVLVRNETAIALGLWALIVVAWEVLAYRKQPDKKLNLRLYMRAYVLPILLVFAIVIFFYARSSVQFPELSADLSEKHTLNVCQIYAYNYQQRFTDWTLSPWTECHDLMLRDFGVAEPSMMQAIRLNPGAMISYFLWNARLIPDGLQVLLFNATSGNQQPDYMSRITDSAVAGVLTLIVLVIIVSGVVLFLRNRRYWWDKWFKDRVWAWLLLCCIACVMVVIMLMQRPRPSYLYPLYIFILVFTGSCLYILSERLRWLKNLLILQPIFAAALIIFLPAYYVPGYSSPHTGANKNFERVYSELRNFPSEFARIDAENQFLSRIGGMQLCMYITATQCATSNYHAIMAEKPDNMPLGEWLAQQNIGLFYIDAGLMRNEEVQAFLDDAADTGWLVLAEVHSDTDQWALVRYAGETSGV